jgi:hypothetical protein
MTLWQASTELLTATAVGARKYELATAKLAGLGMGLEVASEQESELGLGYAAGEQLEAGLSDTSG